MTMMKYIVVLGLLFSLAGCSAARKNYNEARELEDQGRLEEAMYRFAEAVKHDPDEPEYRLKFLYTRQEAAKQRELQGDSLAASGKYAEAVAAYQTASGLDASQPRYSQKAESSVRQRDAEAAYQEGLGMEKGNKLREAAAAYEKALDLVSDKKEYQEAAKRIASQRKSRLDGLELQLKSTKPISLRFTDTKLKEIFAIISQLSGISFIFDNDVKDQNVSITLEKASFHQSLGMLAGMYKLGHKKLNETSILIYPQNPEKVKQYQNMQLRTFYLSYLDVKKAANLVKSMVPVRRLYISEDSNSLVVRDTRDVNDVIEKILEVHDLPDPEVVLDVEVLEINDKSGHDVGLLLSNYSVTLGPFTPGGKLLSPSLSSGTGTTPVDISQLLKAFSIKGFGGYVTVPNATYNFGKTLAQGKILANPKIRVKNKEKSKFTVGQRVPIQTTSSTGTITSSNVQYVDVGIKLNAEPNIQLSNEVVVKLGLEVSSVINKETSKADGTTLLTIGTRNLDTVLSLKDGETVIIGGLIQNTDTDSQTKTFLLGDLPLLGQLLSNSSTSKEKNELLLSITPRLVRGVLVPSRKLTSFTSGKDEDPALLSDYEAFIQEPEYVVSMPVAQPVPPSVQPPIQKQINEPLNPLQSTPPITKQP